jgi:hypothetical protein
MNGLKDWLNETLALILNGSLILNGYERGTVAHDSPFNVTVRIPLPIIGPMVIISLVYNLLKTPRRERGRPPAKKPGEIPPRASPPK